MAVYLSRSEADTLVWAENYAKTLRAGDVVLLGGEMGAGKTVIAKGIAKGLGIREEVTSPTYAYINAYSDRLFHFDCYRIADAGHALTLGFADYFEAGGICLVEWSENIAEILPPHCKRVDIVKRGEEEREIGF